jgi:hypothetical protein
MDFAEGVGIKAEIIPALKLGSFSVHNDDYEYLF